MSYIDDSLPSSVDNIQAPLQPTSVAKPSRTLPPDIWIRAFQFLPVPSLANAALVSRRFKVLIYDDEIWDDKLRTMLRFDTGYLATILDESNDKGSLIDKETSFYINNKPLNALIPGMSTDPYNARSRAKSTGHAREQFKELYTRLLPYYLDLRQRHKESKILKDYGSKPEECGKILNMLRGLGACCIVEDYKQINEAVEALCQYFESASLHEFELAYDVHNLSDMKTYAHALIALNGGSICTQTFVQKHPIFFDNPFKADANFVTSPSDLDPFERFISLIADELKQQSSIIAQVFPDTVDVFYTFTDRVFEDVIAEYVAQLLATAHNNDTRLYLHTMSKVLDALRRLVEELTNEEMPTPIDKERGVNLLFKLFLPFLDDYLYEEKSYVEEECADSIAAWSSRSGIRREDATRLSNQSRETFKRNYLSAFKKVIALPVDLVSTAATTIASPFQRAGTLPSKGDDAASIKSKGKPKGEELRDELEDAQQELNLMQDLLSLEVSLHLIHVNKDSERRVQQFIRIGFPGRMKSDIQRTYEQIFVRLLKSLSTEHIQPAFTRACGRLSTYKPNTEALGANNDEVPQLTEFFELIHVADVIQQMVQLYYDEEITKHIDKMDFMNDVNKEKKTFERILDDSVAHGMDRGIQVLLAQVEAILVGEQRPDDYNPSDFAIDLKPTKACQDTIRCLKTNTSMLNGAAEKSTMDLFFSEIGRRFFEILCKHLKNQTVNEQGGFRYIADMNAYYDFIASLRQKAVTPYFLALKGLANIYIISSAQDIKSVIHDLERYQGLFRIEDLFEFASCRSDWSAIKKVVQKDMTDCCIM
ncbi:exocyst complex component Sec10-like protein [Radiomyces spectabilis]|uniref:exocyst complex component Sec10-like protein n=1 Tax=Radiomyces spectabilis TaxID=64574 RepID=UPI00221FCB3A|nr:exocyst complex component Sec10-like protein [Radiomyces spectabilis]KAI8374177.1 exocyst complex component Sec10-like protein [Radiomyces spectabilis]